MSCAGSIVSRPKPKIKPKRMPIAFPPEMLEILRRRAEENVRSVNGEVIHLIKFALAKLPSSGNE